MDIVSTAKEDMLILDFVGQLDTGTAPRAEVEVNKYLENKKPQGACSVFAMQIKWFKKFWIFLALAKS